MNFTDLLDIKFIVQSSIAILLASIGWLIVHRLTRKRDLNNKKREIALKYLVEVYNTLSIDILKGETSDENFPK
jgi:hypothetical protein